MSEKEEKSKESTPANGENPNQEGGCFINDHLT